MTIVIVRWYRKVQISWDLLTFPAYDNNQMQKERYNFSITHIIIENSSSKILRLNSDIVAGIYRLT